MPRAASTVAIVGGVVLAACSGDGPSAPVGNGNDFFGLDAIAQDSVEDAGDETGDGAYAARRYGELPAGYAPLAMCAQCACPPTSYCFGGAPDASFSATCPQTAGTALSLGCNPVPSACATTPDCVCILMALHDTPCTPACSQSPSGAATVFCPP